MCLDDNHEIETASVLGDTEQMFEYKSRDPACLQTDILAEAMEGRVEPKVFKEIKKLGKFYLETAFDYDLYRYGGMGFIDRIGVVGDDGVSDGFCSDLTRREEQSLIIWPGWAGRIL